MLSAHKERRPGSLGLGRFWMHTDLPLHTRPQCPYALTNVNFAGIREYSAYANALAAAAKGRVLPVPAARPPAPPPRSPGRGVRGATAAATRSACRAVQLYFRTGLRRTSSTRPPAWPQPTPSPGPGRRARRLSSSPPLPLSSSAVRHGPHQGPRGCGRLSLAPWWGQRLAASPRCRWGRGETATQGAVRWGRPPRDSWRGEAGPPCWSPRLPLTHPNPPD